MKRHPVFLLHVLLLAIIPVNRLNAQLSRFEYWFDNRQSGQSFAIGGSEQTVKMSLNTNGLKQGFHTFCYRAVQDDGSFSPVYSSSFLKFNASEGSLLEYWFDGNFENRSAVSIASDSQEIMALDLDMGNDFLFPAGFHRLNIRVAAYGMQYSPIYTAYVMKVPKGTPSQITYWLDDDYSNRLVTSGNADGVAVLSGQLDLSKATPGIHHLKMRVKYPDGEDGAVYEEAIVAKSMYNVQNPRIVAVQSWLDDEVSTEESPVTSSSAVFVQNISLDPFGLTDGNHSFNVRYKNSAGVWTETNVTYFSKQSVPAVKLSASIQTEVGAIADDYLNVYAVDGCVIVEFGDDFVSSSSNVQIFDSYGALIASNSNIMNVKQLKIPVASANGILLVNISSGDTIVIRKVLM